MTRALVCVVRRLNVNVWWHECLLYACLFARRQMPWSSLQGVETSRLHFAAAVFARVKKKKKKNYISVMYCALFPTFQFNYHSVLPIYLILFIYWCGIFVILNMSLLYIYRLCFFVFLKTIPLYNIYPVLYDYYYYFGGCRASGYV